MELGGKQRYGMPEIVGSLSLSWRIGDKEEVENKIKSCVKEGRRHQRVKAMYEVVCLQEDGRARSTDAQCGEPLPSGQTAAENVGHARKCQVGWLFWFVCCLWYMFVYVCVVCVNRWLLCTAAANGGFQQPSLAWWW